MGEASSVIAEQDAVIQTNAPIARIKSITERPEASKKLTVQGDFLGHPVDNILISLAKRRHSLILAAPSLNWVSRLNIIKYARRLFGPIP